MPRKEKLRRELGLGERSPSGETTKATPRGRHSRHPNAPTRPAGRSGRIANAPRAERARRRTVRDNPT
jgi:hypothetical protein